MRRRLRLLVAGLALLLAACTGGPPIERVVTFALDDTADTRLGQATAPLEATHPGRSGIDLLGNPRRTFATLLGLANAAERTLDLQYYAWHGDMTGWLLWQAVWRAAERGVRVRLLLDDLHTVGTDWTLAALDAHPSIEVRLFNPFRFRYIRMLDLLNDFLGSNRRMHNKSFTADNRVSVMGGRNIGDSYFGGATGISFADLDVLAVGPVVREISAQFDRYWNHEKAVPAAAVIRPHAPPPADYLATTFADRLAAEASRSYLIRLDKRVIAQPVETAGLEWGRATLIVDPPEKIDGFAASEDRVIPRLMAAMGVPEERLDIVSAYFVISEAWRDTFIAWAGRGVSLRVLTNSLAGIDVGLAHIGHARQRRALVAGGVDIWEMNPLALDGRAEDAAAVDSDRGFAGSGGTLHAKTAAIDGRRLFVGSLNLDQRSAYLNTEMGLVIDSPKLAHDLHGMFDEHLADHAYQVVLDDRSRLVWLERTPEGEIRHLREPGVGLWRSLTTGIGALLPIDWLL